MAFEITTRRTHNSRGTLVDRMSLASLRSTFAESLTALLIGVNARYKTHAGIRLTGLPDELW